MSTNANKWFDFSEPDVRVAWSSIVPVAFVVLLSISFIPLPAPLSKILDYIKTPFRTYLTLPEAEAYAEGNTPTGESPTKSAAPIWFTLFLTWTALLELAFWIGLATYKLATASDGREDIKYAVLALLKAFSWLYASIKPVLRPTATPPYDLFCLYIIQFITGDLELGGILFDHYVFGLSLPGKFVVAAHVTNIVIIVVLIIIVLSRPMGIPSERVDPSEIVRFVIFGIFV